MSEFWQRLAIAAVVIAVAALVARVVDRGIARRDLAPEAATRYRVLRRSIWITIVFVGVFSALLVIPQVQTIAGGILASSAVLGLVIGFASQRTIGNFVAGLLIAFTQPLRLGDEVEVQGVQGVVEEIGLTYTWIRTRDNDRLVVPNEKLASDTIRNSTIRSAETFAEVEALGIVVKDVDLGLVDFPARRNGEHVLLCWHVGEERVAFWHGVEEGYAGRKPVDWGERAVE